MSQANRAEVLNRLAIIAAIVYLATFLTLVYGGVAALRDQSFFEAVLFAFPRALVVGAALYLCSVVCELWFATTKTQVKQAARPAIDSVNA